MARWPLPHHWSLGSCWQERHADPKSPVLGPFRRRTFIGTIPWKEDTQDTYILPENHAFFFFSRLEGKPVNPSCLMPHFLHPMPWPWTFPACLAAWPAMICPVDTHFTAELHCDTTLLHVISHPQTCQGCYARWSNGKQFHPAHTWVYICRYPVPFTMKHTTRRQDIGQHNKAMTRSARQYRALKKRNFIYQIHRHRPNLFGHSPNCDLPPCSLSPSYFFFLSGPRETQLNDFLRPFHPTLPINFPTHTHIQTNLYLFPRLYMHDLEIVSVTRTLRFYFRP